MTRTSYNWRLANFRGRGRGGLRRASLRLAGLTQAGPDLFQFTSLAAQLLESPSCIPNNESTVCLT